MCHQGSIVGVDADGCCCSSTRVILNPPSMAPIGCSTKLIFFDKFTYMKIYVAQNLSNQKSQCIQTKMWLNMFDQFQDTLVPSAAAPADV